MLKLMLICSLILMNALLLMVVVDFWRHCNDKASKVGFAIMSAIYLLDILTLFGGAVC